MPAPGPAYSQALLPALCPHAIPLAWVPPPTTPQPSGLLTCPTQGSTSHPRPGHISCRTLGAPLTLPMAVSTLVTAFVGGVTVSPPQGAVVSAWPQCLAPTCPQLQQVTEMSNQCLPSFWLQTPPPISDSSLPWTPGFLSLGVQISYYFENSSFGAILK